MPRWIERSDKPLIPQSDQLAFLEARRLRVCYTCMGDDGQPFSFRGLPPNPTCPRCGNLGERLYDRLSIFAGRRYGKTRLGALAGTEEACMPETTGWACAPTNQKLHRYVIPAFQRLIPYDWVKEWSSEFNDLSLRNKSLIHFQTLENPDQGRGQGLHWLWIDEVSELTRDHWDVVSPSLGDEQGVAFVTTSPRGFNWAYEDFYLTATEGIPGFWACQARTIENPRFQSRAGRAFLERERRVKSDLIYRQEYEGEFVTFSGAVYGELIAPQILHTREEIKKILPEWPMISATRQAWIGLDTGADHPFGAVKLVATENGLVVVGEYLERDRPFAQHAEALKRLAAPHPVKWAINRNERQPMLELARPPYHITCQPADNDQLTGTERVKTWLHTRQLWFIEQQCQRTIKQMMSLRYAEPRKDGQHRDTTLVYKKDDELPDCIRYSLMCFPLLPQPVEVSQERNIDHFTPEQQASIQRLRRIDKIDKEHELTVASDFWL